MFIWKWIFWSFTFSVNSADKVAVREGSKADSRFLQIEANTDAWGKLFCSLTPYVLVLL